jgi:hypothetical protein
VKKTALFFQLFSRLLLSYVLVILVLATPFSIRVFQIFSQRLQPSFLDSEKFGLATDQATKIVWGSNEKGMYTQEEYAHLRDVTQLMKIICGIGGVFVLLCFLTRKIPQVGLLSELKVIGVSVFILSLVAAVFFPLVFETFHQLFFPQGNYSFPQDSYLIQVFPPVFWLLNFLALQIGVLFSLALQYWWGKLSMQKKENFDILQKP